MNSILDKICLDFFNDCGPFCEEQSQDSERARQDLYDTLTDEQKLLFNKFDNINEAFYFDHEDRVFRRAFQMGFQLAMEILND